MAGASTPPQYCCDASSSSSPRCLPVSHGRCSHHFLPFPSSSSSRSYRLRQISIIRASGSRRDRDPAGENRDVLNAFFLGKALAESVTERVGTIVGELLSDIGQWQSEQQKQIRDFQEEVQERAEKAKIKAAQGGKHTSTNISYNGSVLGDSTASTLKTRTQENVIQDRTDS